MGLRGIRQGKSSSSLHTSQVKPVPISSFCSMKRPGVLLLPLGWDASLSQGNSSIKFAGTHLYTWVERDTVRVNCLAQEQNTMSPETSALTMRPAHLQGKNTVLFEKKWMNQYDRRVKYV